MCKIVNSHQILRSSFVAIALAAGVNLAFADPTPSAVGCLPPIQQYGTIKYVTGGVGEDESMAMKQAMHRYPLSLEFLGKTSQGAEYLADVPVSISDSHGDVRLKTRAQGPFMLVSLPSGKYILSSKFDGISERRVVDISPSKHAIETFTWPTT